MLVMKSEEYRAMLEAVERALEICRQSLGKMDATHRKICDDLRDARDRLLELLNLPQRGESL